MKPVTTWMYRLDMHWVLWCAAWALMLFASAIPAKSLGVVGETFPIAEQSLLSLIESRVKALDFAAVQQQWIQQAARHAERPAPLNLPRATQSRQFDYVPEIVLGQDILDAKGRVLFQKGMRVNALERLPAYSPCWLFFNADHKSQLLWAKQQIQNCAAPKLILTGGSVRKAEDALHAVIYFDQGGRITQKLGVKYVPAKAVRADNVIRIIEMSIRENGDEI